MLSETKPLRAWAEEGYGGEAFKSYDQISWFIRGHYQELVDSGTFLPGIGARPSLVLPGFDKVVENILMREARSAPSST